MPKYFKIAKIINNYKVVINAGYNQGIQENQRFLIYSLDGEEIFDPDTNKLLGRLEVIKGTARAVFVQDNICTIESDEYLVNEPYDPLSANIASITFSKKTDKPPIKPFYNLKESDLVKAI